MQIREVDPRDVPDDAVLLDVREDDEWQAGHAPDAVHIPLQQLPERYGELPDDQPIHVICKVGGRSAHAAAWLASLGRDAVNVAGGMESWRAVGRPMVSETDRPPDVV